MLVNIGDLNAHYRDHESKDTFKCTSCKKIFGNKESLDKHKRDKHFNYSCELCKKRFETADDLSGHKNSHCEEKYVSCDVCDAKVNNKYDLQKHKRMHTGEKPYSCNHCDRRFISNSALTGHKKIKHSNEKDPIGLFIFNERQNILNNIMGLPCQYFLIKQSFLY